MRLATSNFDELWERNLAAVAEEQRDDVGVGVEAGAFLRHVVRDDHVGAFARELGAGVFGEAFGFGGKTDEDAATARLRGIATELGENVWRGFELEREIRVLRLLAIFHRLPGGREALFDVFANFAIRGPASLRLIFCDCAAAGR